MRCHYWSGYRNWRDAIRCKYWPRLELARAENTNAFLDKASATKGDAHQVGMVHRPAASLRRDRLYPVLLLSSYILLHHTRPDGNFCALCQYRNTSSIMLTSHRT